MPWRRGESSVFSTPGNEPEERYLRHSTKLVRRAAIRRILSGRFHSDGINSLNTINKLLEDVYGIHAHIMTISKDLKHMGAIKVQDRAKPSIQWWVIPAFNPNLENLREGLDHNTIEQEVSNKVAMHVIDIAPVYDRIFIMTEPRAGYLVAYWMSWLRWPGIMYVQEQLDGCIIHCLDSKAATRIFQQLVGDRGIEDATQSEEEEEAADSDA